MIERAIALLVRRLILEKIFMRKQRWKALLKIAWPLILANAFWNIQMTIDRVFLGQFSTEALAAAMAVFGVFWAPMALVQQTASYVMTFVAQLLGAKRPREIGASVWQSVYVSLAGGLLFLILIPLSPALFRLIGHSEQLQILETAYFQAMCFAALPTALVGAASGFFTGLARSTLIVWINGVGMVFNVLFDYLFIFGNFGFPALGIAGAGYATALASVMAAAFGLFLVFREKNESEFLTRSSWKFNWTLMKQFLKFGIPSGMQWALEGLAFTVFLVFVGRMVNGEAALAASGIAVTVMMLALLPALGLAQAVSVLVGQHLGEHKPDDAESVSWTGFQMAALYMLLVGSTFWLFPGFYLSWFDHPENPAVWLEVKTIAPYLFMFVGTFVFFDSMNLVFSFALKGAGDTRFVSLVALALPWPLMVFPTWMMMDWLGSIYWAWGAASIYIIMQAIVFWRRFVGGRWKVMRVIQ
jgi:multidrug resistance protein, MATE family